MSRRGRQAYWAHQSEPEHLWNRWVSETIARAPRMPYPLPGEVEGGWDIYRILEEIERLRPSVEAARREWFERCRAEMPLELRAWLADSSSRSERAEAAKAERVSAHTPASAAPLSNLTPEEKRQRKLQQTRESNARKRAERKALGLPHK